jgi:plastocyanin
MIRVLLTSACILLISAVGSAADWGTITGQVVLKGDVPEPVLLHAKGATIKDAAVCAAKDTYNDDLVVDADTKGIANVFVYLPKAPKDIHPEAGKPDPKVIFDQEHCHFSPHALVVQAGQTVEVLNSDPIAHNTHTYPLRNQAVNILVAPNTAAGAGVDVPTSTRESLPHQVKCDYHPWMMAYWLVLDHPYAAATDAKGNFTIKNLPAGKHEFRVWHERAGYLDRKYTVTVTAGDNDPLKPISVELSQLEEK